MASSVFTFSTAGSLAVKLLLVLASTVILGSDSHGTQEHIYAWKARTCAIQSMPVCGS
jgi:hypothetical protein